MANNLVIWAQDAILPDGINPGNPGYGPLMNSGFNTLMLASFHIHPDGSIWWNTREIVDKAGNVQPITNALRSVVNDLRQNGGFTNCLLSFGGGGGLSNHGGIDPYHSVSDEDFMAFYAAAYATTYGPNSDKFSSPIIQKIDAAVKAIGATGIDVDMEAVFFSYPDLGGAVALLSEWAVLQKGIQLTWTPYEQQLFWQSLWLSLQRQNPLDPKQDYPLVLSWANIQPFAWCKDDDPQKPVPARLMEWAHSFLTPIERIVAGFDFADFQQTPATIQSQLADCVKQNVRVGGAYLWTYDSLYPGPQWTPKQMATAMTNGLNGIPA